MNFEQKPDYFSMSEVTNFDEAVEYTSSVLCNGGVVLIPTDTVYGLICSPKCTEAVNNVFNMKQRPASWRLPIIVADQEQAKEQLPFVWNTAASLLASKYWPGALTIACGIEENNNIEWLAGRDEAAVRVPNYPFIQKLAKKMGPLLMTSANRHGVRTPHTVEGALNSLAIRPTLAIDGGLLSGAPSTLVNVNLPKPVIEREGTIPKTEIERLLYDA